MFAQCSGNSVINSRTVCITLLDSEEDLLFVLGTQLHNT